jgi:hypothetical protein
LKRDPSKESRAETALGVLAVESWRAARAEMGVPFFFCPFIQSVAVQQQPLPQDNALK